MLVVIIENQILAPHQVCQACLLSDRDGQPRWQQGKLGCARLIRTLTCCNEPQPDAYQCQMGFRLMEVE
jgi:hypothetical protein